MNEQTEFYSIDLLEGLKTLWRHKFIVILITIVAMISTAVYMSFFTGDTYTASGVIYVSGKKQSDAVNTQTGNVNLNDIYTARTLSTTYIETLQTRSFLMDVSKDTGSKYTWRQIRGMMTVDNVNETELISISVTANSPQEAYDLTNSIFKNAPTKLSEVTGGGGVKIIDEVLKPENADGKGTFFIVVLSAVLCFFIAYVFVLVQMLFNTKVRKSEDIEKRYGISVLGILAN